MLSTAAFAETISRLHGTTSGSPSAGNGLADLFTAAIIMALFGFGVLILWLNQ